MIVQTVLVDMDFEKNIDERMGNIIVNTSASK